MRRVVAVLALVSACGGGGGVSPDALPSDAPQSDALVYPACREFVGPAINVPAQITGSLSGADVTSPHCASIFAPFGAESAGPDRVVAIGGLAPGTAYIVKLRSAADLGFYVTTGCSTPTGPAADECALFVDASSGGEEIGRFVATTVTAFVVVDFYASHTPFNQTFALEVYAEACSSDVPCNGALPVCEAGRCVQCSDSFDCTDPALPRCEPASNTCLAGTDSCDSDDADEPANDGPAGAVALVLDGQGLASADAAICSSPRSEADFFSFTVGSTGEVWDLSLAWVGTRDLDLAVFTAAGDELGLSYWEKPESVRLTYLAPGTYYARVTDFSQTSTVSVPYTLTAQRVSGPGCTSRADCAATYTNQLFRGDCAAGSCIPIQGNGTVPAGAACDSSSDCASGLSCPSFYFVADADTRGVCAPTCTNDSQCSAFGADYVCTTYLISNFCVQKCTSDEQCPVSLDSQPLSGPWYRLRCQLTTGRCVP